VLLFALALIGGLAAFVRRGLGDANASFLRFLSIYTFTLAAIYSFISYKTPWCLLSFWHGMILLAAAGAGVLLRAARFTVPRFIMGVLLVLGAAQLAGQAWEASTEFAADTRNPYVYAQTSPDILGLVERVQSLAGVAPEGHQMLVKVMAPEADYWPLPWYLRDFKKVGWWDQVPADPFAPVMIVSPSLQGRLGERPTHLMVGYYQLRPQVFLGLYVEANLWRGWLEANTNAAGQSVAK
jgi:predicted membrane-bound mannosyltransferase